MCSAFDGAFLADKEDVKAEPKEVSAHHINAYLIDGPDVIVTKRMKPLSPSLTRVESGSTAFDWGHLTVEKGDLDLILASPDRALPQTLRGRRGANQRR